VAELFGPGDQRAVAAHFVVLDGLRVRHDGGILLDLAGGLVGLFDDPVDGGALGPPGLLPELRRYARFSRPPFPLVGRRERAVPHRGFR
jgi:hypothetical protein